MVNLSEYTVNEKPQWCPGCGDYAIVTALKQAFTELSIENYEAVVVSGIGCGSKLPHYIRTYGYESIHGRLIPTAEGVKLANHKLTVVGIGGDGDGFSEGTNHFIHAARRNNDINYFVQDNHIYALTTGQVSPTTPKGTKTKTTLNGSPISPLKPIPTALIAGATFVASTFAGNIVHMKEVMKKAIQHNGFSFVDIYQPCVSWNKVNTYEWYRERVYDLQEQNHDITNMSQAMEKGMEMYKTNYEKIPIGVFYQDTTTKSFWQNYEALQKEPLIKQNLKRDMFADFKKFM